MMDWTIEELLDRLQTRDECQRIEAKETRNSLGKTALETISAFSNEPDLGGGYLMMGLKKKTEGLPGDLFEVCGVADPDKLQQELSNVCRNNFNRRIIPEIVVHTVEKRSLVIAFIPESFCRDKPIYIKSIGENKGTFRRLGSTDVCCTEEDLDLLYQLRRQRNFESEVLPGVTWEDISQEAINEYRRLRAKGDFSASELQLDDQELLISLKMAVKDKGKIVPTVAGLLFFGNKAALRRELPMASRVDYIVVNGTSWVQDPSARWELSLDYMEALVTLLPRLHAQIMGDIPKKFGLKPGDLQRTDIPQIPVTVIREALLNTLVHRDYRSHQPTQIIRYTNRLEFRNAGYSLKPLEEFEEPGSKPRNPIIATVFYDLDEVEAKGTGIRTMKKEMKDAGLSTPPIFESSREKNEFDLILLPHHLIDREALVWLQQFKGEELTDAQRRALIFVREVGAITNHDYRQLNGTDTLAASRALTRMRDLGFLTQKGAGNGTYYLLRVKATNEYADTTHTDHLSDELISPIEPKSKVGTPHITERTPHIAPKSKGGTPHIAEGTSHIEDGTPHIAPKSKGGTPHIAPKSKGGTPHIAEGTPHIEDGTPHIAPKSKGGTPHIASRYERITIPDDLQIQLDSLKGKCKSFKIKDVIKKLCKIKPCRLAELSKILRRKPRYLRDHYLTKMIENGELKYLYPDQTAHPLQAYLTTE